jgi:hypothetical protein
VICLDDGAERNNTLLSWLMRASVDAILLAIVGITRTESARQKGRRNWQAGEHKKSEIYWSIGL